MMLYRGIFWQLVEFIPFTRKFDTLAAIILALILELADSLNFFSHFDKNRKC